MYRTLKIFNIIAFIAVISINYLSNTGFINNTTIGEVSGNYNTLFTPAGYTFVIWGLIYLMLLGFVIYQGRRLFSKNVADNLVLNVGWWFILSCLSNIFWVFAWLNNYIGLSCILIFSLLFCILKIVVNTRIALDDKPITTIAFLWWPFTVYAGWVTVASIANVSAYLNKIAWDGFGLSDTFWAVFMIIIAVIINILVVSKRNMREFAVVGAWALVGIAMANKSSYPFVMYASLIGASILLILVMIHGWKNRATNPFIKLKQYLEDKQG